MLFTAAVSAYTDTVLSAVIERQILVFFSLQLSQFVLILILSAVIERQDLVCSSLPLSQLILIIDTERCY